ncbi:MAG: hypothetical protein V4684_15710 [Pseudomonadota bacterium]
MLIRPEVRRPLAVAPKMLTAEVAVQADGEIEIGVAKRVELTPLQGHDAESATAELMKLLSASEPDAKAVVRVNALVDQLKAWAKSNHESNVFNKSFLAAVDAHLVRLSQFELADFRKRFDDLLGGHLMKGNRDVAGRFIATTIASRIDFYLSESIRLAPRSRSPLRREAASVPLGSSPARAGKALTSEDARLRSALRTQLGKLSEPMDEGEMMDAATALARTLPLDQPWRELDVLQAHLADDLLGRSDAELAMFARNLINLAQRLPHNNPHLTTLQQVLVDVLALRGGLVELAATLRQTKFGPSVQEQTAAVASMSLEDLKSYATSTNGKSIARDFPLNDAAMRAAVKTELAKRVNAVR